MEGPLLRFVGDAPIQRKRSLQKQAGQLKECPFLGCHQVEDVFGVLERLKAVLAR